MLKVIKQTGLDIKLHPAMKLCYGFAVMRKRALQRLILLALGLLATHAAAAQVPPHVTGPVPRPTQTATDQPAPAKDKIKRWFEIEQLSLAARYHFIELENRRKSANNLQYQFVARFRFKFDSKGRYSVAANAATGSTFTSGWNGTGLGTGDIQRDLNLKQLYFDAKPAKAVEVQAGGLFINYGLSTEVTEYDNDSYITGERLLLRMPHKLYFDQVSVTYARLADLNTPNVFRRLRHLGKQNYHQFLVQKQVNKTVGFSGDYTFQSGMDIFRQAVKISLPKRQVLDTLLVEAYEQTGPRTYQGFNIFGEKALHERLTVSGGFARIGPGLLNGDRFPPGKRLYLNTILKLTRELSFTTQVTEGVGRILPTVPRTRVDVILSCNILTSLKRTGLF